MEKKSTNSLHNVTLFSLFVSSYLPLFVLIAIKQISDNYHFIYWGGFSLEAIRTFLEKFGLSALLVIVSIIGFLGFKFTFRNLESVAENGQPVVVSNVRNKSGEAIGYIATYIIPFLFNEYKGWYECFSVLFLLAIICPIYIHSSLLLINPLLSIWFSIYELEYYEQGKSKYGFVVSRNRSLYDNSEIKIYEIGYKLFFAKNIN
ncbi:hypothetical protein [Fluviicola sp.]|uniref:hypothetical protein n=1 Tax=Fluviicola sp. TaxID=1917219 RepID=UPI0031D26C85